MSIYQIPVSAMPSQSFNVIINSVVFRLDIYQRSTGLYMNVWVLGSIVISGAICQNLNPVIHSDYLGLGGDFVWVDTQGSNDPTYDGLGSRYVLTFTGA